MKNKAALLVALLSTSVHAVDIEHLGNTNYADVKLIAGYASYHLNSENHKYLNESNPAIGVEAWDIQAVYVEKNSWDSESLYLTYSPDYEFNSHLSVSAQAGIATGYTCDLRRDTDKMKYHINYCSNSGVVPLVAVTLSIKPIKSVSFDLSITPIVAMFSVGFEM